MQTAVSLHILVSLLLSAMATAAMSVSHVGARPDLQPRAMISSTSGLSISYVECNGSKSSNSHSSTAPTTLLIHGLDSSSHTWRSVQQSRPSPSIAIDCRGCGRSDLGDPEQFSPSALVEDIQCLVDSHPWLKDRRFVLVGHSMGGRVAIEYAATHPENVAALVVEDMDIRRRSAESNFITNFDEAKALAFEKGPYKNLEDIRQSFREIGYPDDMVQKWIDDERIYQEESSGCYWSGVHPAFRALCYRTVFDSDCGTNSWDKIVAQCVKNKKDGGKMFDISLMVAGIGTVCDDKCIEDMRKVIEDIDATSTTTNRGGRGRVTVKTYDQGTHSIHNSVQEEFLADLENTIRRAAVS